MGTMESDEDGLPGMGKREEKIFVSVRIRPLNGKEIAGNDLSDWECIDDNTIIYKNPNILVADRSMYPSAFTFDRVFSPDCSTRQVYKEGAKEVVMSVVSGVNSSIFAYGQTSSGKTFTMTGITEYTVADIYDYVQKHRERDFLLKFSAMEIYSESVRDLLGADSSPLRLLDDPERGTIVEKLTEETLRDWHHLIRLLSICEAQRQIGETSLNETSSRSHQIIRLTVESSVRDFLSRENSSSLVATVNFVDLAGSERASQSLSAGARLKEGSHINRSLLTLGTVIRKLSKGRSGHVPFRDSKLTRILQSSLGGNARTAIICTMSPARSHVEQSRNTLSFASCAKEVTTNAQVNIVVSDKALVKQLQTQLVRLESEVRSSGSTFVTSNSGGLLRERDLQIEKLENQIKDLILQRDIAQSQVQDMARLVGEDGNSSMTLGPAHYPNLRVRRSPEFGNLQRDAYGSSQFSDGESGSSSEDIHVQLPGFDENSNHNNTPPRLLISTDHFSESDLSHGLEEIEEKTNRTSEDVCKDVGCIETEEFVLEGQLKSSYLSPKQNMKLNGEREHLDLSSSRLSEDRAVSSSPKEDRESVSPRHDLEQDLLCSENLNLMKSRSCEARFVVALSSPMIEHDERTPANGSKKHFTGRPPALQRKFAALKFGSDVETLSRDASSRSSVGTAVDTVLEAQDRKKSTDENITTFIPGLKEMAKLHYNKPAKEIKMATNGSTKSVKYVGLDPIKDGLRSPSNWPAKFKRLRREIIQLWHACNMSLIHRSYFFLLFKGDPADSIYMEVELRRLSFLKDSFSRENQPLQESSMKAIRRERQMLSKQMQKRFSEEEREILYLRWGVGLNSKNRRLRLVDRLWSNTENLDHIKESALLIAKLVGVEPVQARKEAFGLHFAPCNPTQI